VSSITSGHHVASPVNAAELRARLKILAKSSGQHGLGAKVQTTRSSQRSCERPLETHRRSVFSQLCRSLICIRPAPESPASSPSSLRNSQERRLSGNAGDDGHACVVSANVAETGRLNEALLSAYPIRMEEEITVDWRRAVGYCESGALRGCSFYVYGRQYAFRSHMHLQQLSTFDRLYTNILPFYRERLSHQWHSGMFHTIPVFSKGECAFIDKAKIACGELFSYMAVNNACPQRNGNAKIYYARRPAGSIIAPSPLQVIELYGELVPVRILNNGRYEVYRRDKPAATALAVAWDGQRWISARHEASRLDKRLTNTLNHRPDIRQHDLSTRDLFFTDEKGIYRHQKSGKGYIKNGGDLFLLEPVAHSANEYLIQHGRTPLMVSFTGGKLRPTSISHAGPILPPGR
jgi:hypothetical protein